MKKLTAIIATATAAALIGGNLFAAFPANENTTVVDIDQVTGNFDSFNYKWIGEDDQNITWTLTNASGYVDMTGYLVAARISKDGTIYVDIPTGDVTISNSNITFSVARTNIPPNSDYDFEGWALDGATTNLARTVVQGRINVSKSLYQDTNTYPFATSQTNLSDYLTVTQAVATYAQIATTPTNAVMDENAGTNYVTWVGGGLLTIGIDTNSQAGDITAVTVSGGFLAGGTNTGSANIDLTTNSLDAVFATDAELSAATNAAVIDATNRAWSASTNYTDAATQNVTTAYISADEVVVQTSTNYTDSATNSLATNITTEGYAKQTRTNTFTQTQSFEANTAISIPLDKNLSLGTSAGWNVTPNTIGDELSFVHGTLLGTAPAFSLVGSGNPRAVFDGAPLETTHNATSLLQVVNYQTATNLIAGTSNSLIAYTDQAEVDATNSSYIVMTNYVIAATNDCFQKTGGTIIGDTVISNNLDVYSNITVFAGTNVLNESDTVLAGTGLTKSGAFSNDDLTVSLDQDYTDARYVQSSTNIFDEVTIGNDQFLGSELTTNGTFDANANGWTLTNATWSSGNSNILINALETNAWITSSNQLGGKVGDVYSITYSKLTANSDEIITIYYGGRTYIGVAGVSQTITNTIGATESNTFLTVGIQAVNNTVYIDDISVKKITEGDLYVADDAHFSDTVYVGGVGRTTWPSSGQIAEQDFEDDAAQVFSAGVITIVTNFYDNIVDATFTTTDSNTTVLVDGRYKSTMNLSFNSNTGAADVDCELYTNGVMASTTSGQNIGWARTVSSQNSDGTIACTKSLTLLAGDVLDWRITTVATETLQWTRGTIRLEQN